MPNSVRVCSRDEVGEGELKRFVIGDLDVLLTRVGGQLYGLQDRCGHMSAPFSMGKLDETRVVCPNHGAVFDLTSGQIVSPPNVPPPSSEQAQQNPRVLVAAMTRTYPVKCFAVEDRDGGVFVELP